MFILDEEHPPLKFHHREMLQISERLTPGVWSMFLMGAPFRRWECLLSFLLRGTGFTDSLFFVARTHVSWMSDGLCLLEPLSGATELGGCGQECRQSVRATRVQAIALPWTHGGTLANHSSLCLHLLLFETGTMYAIGSL